MGFGGSFLDVPAVQSPILSGTAANRPPACYRNAGSIYVATDTGTAYYSTGTAWVEVSGSGGGGVSSVTATSPLASSGGSTPNITHDTSGATAGSYTNASITIDQYGHVTAASNGSGGGSGGVNHQTANYSLASTDDGKLVSFDASSAITCGLPTPATLGSSWYADIENVGSGTVTIQGSANVDGVASLALNTNQGCRLFCDGTNYFTQRGVATSGGVTSIDGITGAVTLSAGAGINIFNNSPSAGDISISNSGVTSLQNGASGQPVTGAVELSAGSGITIANSGGQIFTISASGGSGTVTSIATTSPILGGTITASGTISHANSGVTAGPYTSPSSVTVDQWGHVTSITSGSTASANPSLCCGRLTQVTGNPAEDGYSTTLYFTPYQGNLVSLYNGSEWVQYTLTEISSVVSGLSGGVYDVFLQQSSGTLSLNLQPWTNNTTRTTSLAVVDGVYVNGTYNTWRYLGTVFINASGQLYNNPNNRCIWNYYHRLRQALYWQTTDSTWSYTTTGIWRQANGNTANQVNFVVGVEEDDVQVRVEASCDNTSATYGAIGLGLDSIVANNAIVTPGFANVARGSPSASWVGKVLGYHYVAWLEWTGSASSPYPYWYGASSPMQSGMTGSIMC